MLTRNLVALIFMSVMAMTTAQTTGFGNIGTGGAFLAGLALPFIFNRFRRQPLPVVVPYPIQTNFNPFNPFPAPMPFFPGGGFPGVGFPGAGPGPSKYINLYILTTNNSLKKKVRVCVNVARY